MGVPIRQPEMFVMPKMKQDNGQSAAIPRLCPNKYRRESYLTFRIDCKNKLLFIDRSGIYARLNTLQI